MEIGPPRSPRRDPPAPRLVVGQEVTTPLGFLARVTWAGPAYVGVRYPPDTRSAVRFNVFRPWQLTGNLVEKRSWRSKSVQNLQELPK